jgi:tetratricopeptide (TPR) repeat protein
MLKCLLDMKLNRAALCVRRGDLKGAEEVLGRILAGDPGEVSALMQYAELATARKDWAQAVERWERVLGVSERERKPLPQKAAVKLKAARLKHAAKLSCGGDYEGAEEVLGRILARDPGEGSALTQYAELATSRKDWAHAVERWERVCESAGEPGRKMPDKAAANLVVARVKIALERVEQRISPKSTQALDDPLIILIGGSPGSGTTLLLVRLASHKWAIGVNESGLFSHPDIYCDFKRFFLNYTSMIESGTFKLLDEGERLRKGLSPHLLANSNRIEAHGLSAKDISRLIQASTSEKEYLSNLALVLSVETRYCSDVIIEKTPSNIYALPSFLDGTPRRRGIVIVRDPIDMVSSLISRGLPIFRAMALWTVEAALALVIRDKEGGILVRYEDFVYNPVETEDRILELIGMPSAPSAGSCRGSISAWPMSWRSSPLQDVSRRSVERGLNEFDDIDRMVFSNLAIMDFPGHTLNNFFGVTAETISAALGYQIAPESNPDEKRVRIRLQGLKSRSVNTEPRIGRSNFYDGLVYLKEKSCLLK